MRNVSSYFNLGDYMDSVFWDSFNSSTLDIGDFLVRDIIELLLYNFNTENL